MQEILSIFKALSDETRLRILKLLEHGELCVCDIFSALDMIQPKVSFHLSVLKEAGLIKDRKAGRWVHYSLDDSDMLRRFMLHTVIERVSEDVIKNDRERLRAFLGNKEPTTVHCDLSEAPAKKIKVGGGCKCSG